MKVDWTDLTSVVAFAQTLADQGPAQVVYKLSSRDNFNICHLENWERNLRQFEERHQSLEFVATVTKQ